MITEFNKYQNGREINIYKLYKDMLIKHNELGLKLTDVEETLQDILNKVLVNNHVEIQKVINPIDGEITFNEKGTLEWIKILSDITSDKTSYVVKLKYDENKYWLNNNKYGFDPIIKVYGVDESDIEFQIKMLSSVDKYNL